MNFTYDKRRYLLLLPILIMAAFSIYFSQLQKSVNDGLLNEKFEEKKEAVEMMSYQMDAFIAESGDWETNRQFYEKSLQLMTEKLDETYMTFAAVYDESLELVSRRQYSEDSGFDPLAFPEFRDAAWINAGDVRDAIAGAIAPAIAPADSETPPPENGSGELTLHFESPGETTRDILVFWKWIPTSADMSNRFLVVVGISRLTVVTHMEGWVTGAAVALMLITALLNGAMVWIITKRNPRVCVDGATCKHARFEKSWLTAGAIAPPIGSPIETRKESRAPNFLKKPPPPKIESRGYCPIDNPNNLKKRSTPPPPSGSHSNVYGKSKL